MAGKHKRNVKAKKNDKNRPSRNNELTAPFVEHFHELRKRIFYIALSVGFWSIAAYAVEHQLIDILLRPAHGEKFIYTSPGGGIDFLFRVTLYAGVVFSIPVIVYNILRYLQPLMKESMRFIAWGSIISGILAAAGMLFGYFLGLPAALHFLLNQFTTVQIQPLVTIQSYMAFVSMYMFGSSLLFQIPLLLLFINRIKPLQPRKLLSLAVERWVILGSVVLAFLMNPSPNVIDQMLIVGPMIGMYQLGILMVWYTNRKQSYRPSVQKLFELDAKLQADRDERREKLQILSMPVLEPVPVSEDINLDEEQTTYRKREVIAVAAHPVRQDATISRPVTKPERRQVRPDVAIARNIPARTLPVSRPARIAIQIESN